MNIKYANPLQSLLSILYLFVPLLEEFDTLNPEYPQSLRSIWSRAIAIDEQVKIWETCLLNENEGYLQNRQEGFIGEYLKVFPNLQTAAALLYKEVYRVHLNTLLIGLLDRDPITFYFESVPSTRDLEIDRWGCMERICPMFDYFFDQDKRLSGRMMFLLVFQTGLMGISEYGEHEQCSAKEIQACGLVCTKIAKEGYLPWDECADRWASLRESWKTNSQAP